MAALVFSVVASMTGCATHERVVVRETVVRRHMPAPVREERGQWPGQGWEWMPGHWKWEGNDWLWVHEKRMRPHVEPTPPIIVEKIITAPSPQHYWVPGHWVWDFSGHGGWVGIKGSWRR